MNVGDVVGAARRLWVVALILAVATVALASRLWIGSEVRYRADATISVIATQEYLATRDAVGDRNPYSGSPSTVAELLAKAIEQQGISLREERGVDVAVVDGNAARAQSFLTLSIEGASAGGVKDVVDGLEELLPAMLADLQARADVPDGQRFTAFVSSSAAQPEQSYPQRLQATLAALLGGAVLTAVIVVALDGAIRRSSRRESDSSDTSVEPSRG